MQVNSIMRWQDNEQSINIPLRHVGPLKIVSDDINDSVLLPLATLESPLWPSTHRAAKLVTAVGGLNATLIDERMSRSILVEADTVAEIHQIYTNILGERATLQQLVAETSQYAKLLDINGQLIGSMLYLRFELSTGDAAGHNMVTLASDRILHWLLAQYPKLRHLSVSGNFCTDKKVSAVNGILGRGKHVIAECFIPREMCNRYLKTDPEKIVELHIKKNLIGSIVSGSLGSANAHFANILLALYLATGQDAANIIEGSQGIVHAEMRGSDTLYFSVNLPNIIVGTVGSGKGLPQIQENLRLLGCLDARAPGKNARRLAIIIAGAVLCGELSLLAALTNPGELMKGHIKLERAV